MTFPWEKPAVDVVCPYCENPDHLNPMPICHTDTSGRTRMVSKVVVCTGCRREYLIRRRGAGWAATRVVTAAKEEMPQAEPDVKALAKVMVDADQRGMW